MIVLTMTKAGENVMVARVGGNPEMKKHLEDLGFVPGTPVQILSQHHGDVIVKLKEARLAITEQMAGHVMVQD